MIRVLNSGHPAARGALGYGVYVEFVWTSYEVGVEGVKGVGVRCMVRRCKVEGLR